MVYFLHVFIPKPYIHIFSPFIQTCYITRPSHSSYLISRIISCEQYRTDSHHYAISSNPPVTPSLLGPNIFPAPYYRTPSAFLTLYVPCIMFRYVDKPTRCNPSYELSLLSINWLYMFRTVTSPLSGASSHKLYNALVCSCRRV